MKKTTLIIGLCLAFSLTNAQTNTTSIGSTENFDKVQTGLVKLFQSYCDAIHHGDAKAAVSLQSKELNHERNLNEPLSMKMGQHVIPRRFEVLKATIDHGNRGLKLRGWFMPEKGTNDVPGEIEAVFVQEEGGWKLQSTMLKLDSFPKEKPGQADDPDAERLENAKGLVAKMDASLKAEIKQMMENGKKLDACKRVRDATGADLPTAFQIINMIHEESAH